MKRKITTRLIQWKAKERRMPLLLNGARQVGKTYILKEFGATHYANMVYVNLETNLLVSSYFEKNISPRRILEFLETDTGQRILPAETLIVLDEIQSCERALLSLKTFCEEAPEYHIVAAGSLLGVALHHEHYSFPVGKVDELTLYPLDFEEFLWAHGKEKLASLIRQQYVTDEPLPEALHEDALELYRKYLIVGGMPSAVVELIRAGSLLAVPEIQQRIVNEYIADMAKYAVPSTTVKIRACYKSIPSQLAKDNHKFQYKVVQQGGSAALFGESIDWLDFAGIVLKCQKANHGIVPLAVQASLPDFKLYMGDVGILTMLSGMPQSLILTEAGEGNTFMGALTENYVAQNLTACGIPLYYWRSSDTAEVDFVWQHGAQIIPIEVKAGIRTRSKSLNLFMQQYRCKLGYRISQKNFGRANGVKSIPLYATFCIGSE
jgi:hypothetical protein